MKNNILKSIFVTILLLLGASHAAWGAAEYSLAGTIPGCNWGDNVTFDEHTNTVTITLDGTNGSSSQTYEFKVKGCNNWDNSWGLDDGEISTSGSLQLVYKKGNVKFHPNGAGDYKFKWDPTTTTITITYPSAGAGTCTASAAPAEVIAGTNVMFYVQSYNGDKVTIGTSAKDVSAAKYTNVADGKSYINIAKASLENNIYITNNPGNWDGKKNEDIKSAEGGEYFVGNDNVSTTAAKTATTTTTINGNTLNISTTANSTKGVYNNLQLYIQYYIDANFAGVTYSGEEATYCSIKASTSAVSSTYDISSLSTGEHTLLTVLTDGNIYYIADTDNFSVGSTYTVTFNANGHGTAPATQNVTSGGKATEPAAPTATGFTFGGWYTEAECTNKYNFSTAVTENITLYAKWTAENTYSVTITAGEGGSVLPSGEQQVGSSGVTIKATPNTGYVFDKWTVSGGATVASSTSATTTVTATATGTVTANFKASSTNFYYYDGKGGWSDDNCVKFTKETEYAYATLTGYQQNNEFKIFDGNTKSKENWYKNNKDNDHTVACAPHIDNSLGNIALGKAGSGNYDNAKFSAASIPTSTFYVILYYPNTTLNKTSNYKLCASTTLPGGIAPAQDWYVYGAGGELSWDKNSGKKMSLHGDGYYYYTCSGVSQFKIDGSTLTDYALGGTYISNSFPDAATANITLADAGEEHHNITVTNATGEFEIRLYPAGKAGNTTSNHIIIAHRNVIAAGDFWYFDENNTGWDNTIADKWKLVDAGDYAYVSVPARNSNDNFFKIFPVNPKDDNKVTANGNNIADGDLAGEIKLTAEGGQYNNIKIAATTADYYVILYYPKTSTNSSDKYLVAATYDLPGVQKYAVSFGVVGKTGGTITAKSGSSTITSGQLVSRATFTATPAAGYSVEGWYSDAEGTHKIDAAGTKTTYSQAITEANNSVYVKFAKAYAIYYKFNDQKWNDNYYAYIFTDEVWHSDNGVQPKVNRSEYGKMSKYNDSVYYYKFTKSADYTRFAFSWGDHSNKEYFDNIDAVYRSDFHKDMPVFIAERGQSASDKKAHYYNKGVWMKFNDTDPGYNLCLTTDNGSTWNEKYRFTAAKAGDYISTVNVELTKDVTYKFWVKNDKPYYFKTEGGTCTPTNHQFTFYTYDKDGSPITITPAVTGTYTFQLNLANGKVEIDVLYPTTSYRLVYVEQNGGTIEKFHPSHIIKSHPEATKEAPMFDTVSMHVRLKLLQKKAAVSGTTDVKYDTLPNSNTCEVWLQEFKADNGAMDWKTIQTIDTLTNLATNGVYNFIIKQAAGSATIEPTIRPYTGRYYIRTDASDGGWNNYKKLSNYCYYTEYSRVYRGFDYYFCRWASKANIKYTIACDYSYCVSDTLAQEDHAPHSIYTDGEGTLQHEANVRFMWHSFSNELDRAYIAGAGDNLYLMSNAGIYDMKGNQNTSAKLEDQQNWVYRVDVKADTKARIKLRAVPYNSATTYSWFRGRDGDGDFSEANTEQLIEGKSDTQYTIRVIYDFKTDHLICAWIPDKDTITANDVINADLMIIRTDQGEAAQLNFKPNETKVENITVAYCVLNLTNGHLSSTTKSSKEKSCYWVSFPFDVNLSDVFGCGKYGEDFIIQYYDGAERAQKGCWADSPTYWKYITNPTGVVLKKGMGYVLVIDYEKILSEQFKHSNTSVNIYFPSSGPIDAIDGVLPTAVEVPKHECTITRNDRYIYDSNWNIIGIPTWANIDKFGNPMVATQSTSNLSQGGTETYTIGFYYAHDAKNNKWTVCDTKEVDFLSMYSYLVQWSGTINWAEKSASGKHHPTTLAPRRYAPAAEGEEEAEGAEAPEQYTLRLTLNRGEQQLDHTYVRLQEGNVTTDFDLNYDMTKILNDGTNLYSLVGTNLIQCAANVQPLQEEAQTISIPLGVVADQDGLYTFSLPEGTEGMNVSIADSESGTVHNLALGDYQTALTAGTYEQRFALEIQPRQGVSTGCEQTDAAGKSLRKVLIDGNLYILRDGKAYTAAGQEL